MPIFISKELVAIVRQHHKSVLKGIFKLFKDSHFCDSTIRCKSTEWRVHRVVVCSQSTILNGACSNPIEEGVIVLDDDLLPFVEQMIIFLYTLNYESKLDIPEISINMEGATDEKSMVIAPLVDAHMYALGGKYRIWRLKELSKEKFIDSLESASKQPYFKTCSDYIVSVIKLVYDSTPHADRGLRDVIKSTSKEFMSSWLKLSDGRDLLRRRPQLALDICDQIHGHPLNLPWPRTGRVEQCGACLQKRNDLRALYLCEECDLSYL
ncbi:MAG: hypothetical protein M1834_007524 [Cirrosporium novae-zelandiae]|nr:MAG: hypothetical protein M1834_007524 [Cirrosporium novae-zelandiae]